MKALLRGVFLLTVTWPMLPAQVVGSAVGGRVTDETATAVPGAWVSLRSTETGRERRAASGEGGEFHLATLPPGECLLEVSREGYRTYTLQLTLLTGQEVWLDVALAAGRRTDRVEVRAARSLLTTDSASLGTVVENHLIRGLPLDGRNFLELSLLLPGVAPAAEGSASSVRGEVALNVSGAREDSNNFLLDGVVNGDPKLNNLALNPNVDAIREFEVLSSTYDASFGRNAGGQVNVVLRSGANDWRGTVYYFQRNAAVDARNFFAPAAEPDPRYQRHQYGFSAGGALRRNSTFVFGDYEGLRLKEGVTRTTNVPTLLERAGDFSRSERVPFDPLSGQPLPGGTIPAFYLDPIGQAIANLYPAPNRTAPRRNFASSPAVDDRSDRFDVRLDQALGQAGTLAVRYSLGDETLLNPFSGPSFPRVPGYGVFVPRRAQNIMASETHAFSASWVNELRAGFNRISAESRHQNYGISLNRQVGLPEISANSRAHGLSLITMPGFSPLGDETNNPQASATNVYQVTNNTNHARGRHLVKFGADLRHTQQNAFRDVQARGFLNFLGFTQNPLADLLLGLPSVTGVAVLDNPQYLRTTSYNFFVNDTWRLRANWSVSAGVRYEFNTPPVDRYDRANVYDASTKRLVQVGTNGIPRSGYTSDRNNWAPRIGVAWRPGGGATVLRVGYGLFFDQGSLAPGEGLYFSPPYFDFRLFFALPGMPLTLQDPFPANFPMPSPPSALSYQRDLRSPYLQHWSLSIQRRLGASRLLEAAYVGSKGTKQLTARDINQPAPSPVTPNLRPNPLLADIDLLESRSNSSYQSLQARFQQYWSGGVSVLASYTFSKSLDDASSFFTSAGDANFPQDSALVAAERGRSNFDVRQRLTASYSWALPFGRGRKWLTGGGPATGLFGGWQTFGIWTFQTGRPFTVALLPEVDNSNTGRSILGFGANDRPNLARNAALDERTPERWFDTDAFTMPRFGAFGNAGRNILDGPGLQTINVSLLRDFTLGEGLALQFRAESFNLLNRANFDLPDIFFGSPTFGQISSARHPRRIQFGLKVLF